MEQCTWHTNIFPENDTALSVSCVLMLHCFPAAWPRMKLSFILTKAILMHLGETKSSNNTPQVYEKNTLLHSHSIVKEEYIGTHNKNSLSHLIFSKRPEEVKLGLGSVQQPGQWCNVGKWWAFPFIYFGRFPRLPHICTVKPLSAGSRTENMQCSPQCCGDTSGANKRACCSLDWAPLAANSTTQGKIHHTSDISELYFAVKLSRKWKAGDTGKWRGEPEKIQQCSGALDGVRQRN